MLERAVETMRQGLAPEDLAPALVHRELFAARRGLERHQRLGIAFQHPLRMEEQRADAGAWSVAPPTRESPARPPRHAGDHEPQMMRGVAMQALSERGDDGAQRRVPRRGHQQRASSPRANRDARGVDGEPLEQWEGGRDRERIGGEAEQAEQVARWLPVGKAGQQVGGEASCKHTRTVPAVGPPSRTGSLHLGRFS